MKRALFVLAIAALALPSVGLAKGPSAATIDGPGADGIVFGGGRKSGLFALSEQAGLFPAVFAREPDPMLERRPDGRLGPKYTILWTVPGPNNEAWKLRQELYPFAEHGPVTYMAPGQAVYGTRTHGGWYLAGPGLTKLLSAAGLPASAPSAGGVPRLLVPALALLLTAAVLLGRRVRPAARMAGSPS